MNNMQHNFDVELAKEYGILEAILIQNIYFWIEKNKANNKHFYDGRYWTYNSRKAFSEMFPYASEKQIRRALEKLETLNILITGNYNKQWSDRTLWYSFSDIGLSIVQQRQMQLSKKANDKCLNGQMTNAQEGKAIPYINTDINTDNITPYNPPKGESENLSTLKNEEEQNEIDKYNFEIMWDEYPRKEGRTKAFGYFKQWVRGRKINGKTIKLTDMQIYDAVRAYAKEKKYTETKYIQQGSTFFNTTILDYVDME